MPGKFAAYNNHLLVVLALLLTQNANAQGEFLVTIEVPQSINVSKIQCSYDNGVKRVFIDSIFNENKIRLSGKFYSSFAALEIAYKPNDTAYFSKEYFVEKLPAKVVLAGETDKIMNPFTGAKLENIFEIYQTDPGKRRNEFSKGAITVMNEFVDKNGDNVWRSDSLTRQFFKNLDDVNKRDIEFVKGNKNDYFSFWFFRTQIVPITFMPKEVNVAEMENLLDLYNAIFSDLYDSTSGGKYVREFLADKIEFNKTGWLAIKRNHLAPDFSVEDIEGRTITSSSLKGKYVLLDFWATWCGPCMEEIPIIKKIRANFSPDRLSIIGISSDYNYNKFLKGIKDHEMNWTHIYDNERINNLFGVDAIPTTYLIDEKGIIVFSSKEDDQEVLVKMLTEINNGKFY